MLAVRGTIAAFILALTAAGAVAGDGCRYPFVWREAFPGDHVCVTPDIRAQAASDNAAAGSRVNPDNHDYGPDTCRYGFVWREARPSDHVCVTPETRARAARDNAEAPGRYAERPRHGYNPVIVQTGCCPNSMLVCPLGRHFCR